MSQHSRDALSSPDQVTEQALHRFVQHCIQNQQIAPALEQLTALIDAYPEDVSLREMLVKCYMLSRQYAEALPHLAFLAAQEGDKDFLFYLNYFYALHCVGDFEQCLGVLEEAIAAYPGNAELLMCRGGTRQVLGDYDGMIADYRAAAECAPGNSTIRYALGLRELMVNNLSGDYGQYRHRVEASHAEAFTFAIPRWQGEPATGKKVLLIAEQGVGDMVMFASLIPWLVAEGLQLRIAVPEKLQALFARSFPGCEVVSLHPAMKEDAERECDYYLPMGDLLELGLPRFSPAKHGPYLIADPAKAETLRERYLALHPGKTRLVGIAWHTTNAQSALMRNIDLAQWMPILSLPEVQCVSLQYGDHDEAIRAVNAQQPDCLYVDREIDAFDDMDALAAQIAAMDQVVTIQNVTAHLGGALGIPTLLLLSSGSDWRWGIQRSDSTWYSTVEILRQQHPLDWQGVMADAAGRIA